MTRYIPGQCSACGAETIYITAATKTETWKYLCLRCQAKVTKRKPT
jgi:DNA-directed RNA polymerase subunit RPC12/RpoP